MDAWTTSTEFTLHNIPFGVISYPVPSLLNNSNNTDEQPCTKTHRIATAIGDYAVDLSTLKELGFWDSVPLFDTFPPARDAFDKPTLNEFMGLGRPFWRAARSALGHLFANPSTIPSALRDRAFIPLSRVRNHLPATIGDYTDFYASKEHAINVGSMFRDPKNALLPNWVHLPVGYHGRASSIVASGTPITRPCGQILNADKLPYYSPSKKLDIELEVAFFVGKGNALGSPILISQAEEHIFGMVLMNDWSARDIQQFEYAPLGPFLGKNFGTTISPWIVTMDALEPFRVPQPIPDPAPLPYLTSPTPADAYDVQLQVDWIPATQPVENRTPTTLVRSNLKYMYWSFKQQLAHHSINGCNMRPGDLCGSGTISGAQRHEYGSLLELTDNGKVPLPGGDGVQCFLADGDEVILRGWCSNGKGVSLGFGECRGVILPAPQLSSF